MNLIKIGVGKNNKGNDCYLIDTPGYLNTQSILSCAPLKTLKVLVESITEKNGKRVLNSRADNNKIVHFESSINQVGDFVDVKINKAQTWCLYGEPVG